MEKSDWVALILILLVSIFGIKALFQHGFYTSHDGEHQVLRLIHFVKGLKDGQVPVRWAGPPAFKGFGYPLFIFTYRLPFSLAALVYYLFGLTLTDSIKSVFIFAYLLSGVFMYVAQKKIWQDRLAALLGAIFYLWAPWRFSNILVQASLGMAVCFIFFPLFLWAIFSLEKEKNYTSFFIGAFSLAGLILSHAPSFFISLPFLLTILLFLIFQSKNKKNLLTRYFLIFVIALSVSAFYWLPATIEKKYTVAHHIFSGFYRQHFVTLKQLIYSKWDYGLSHPGTEQDAMSFQVGIGQWLAVFLSSSYLIYDYWRKKTIDFFNLLLIFLFILSIFLMIQTSDFIWQIFAPIFTLNFPFRFLTVSTLISSLVAGSLVKKFKNDRFLKIFQLPLILFLLLIVFYSNRNHLRVNQYSFWPDAYYENLTESSSSFDEYRPEWVNPHLLSQRDEALTIEEGRAKINSQTIRSNQQKFEVEVQEESLLRLNTIYFPGWQLFVDGKKRKIKASSLNGLIQFNLATGSHEVLFKFGRTWDRTIGEMTTIFSLMIIAYQLKKIKRKDRFC